MDNSKHLTLLSVLFLTFDSILLLVGIGFLSGFSLIGNLINEFKPSAVVNFAAESHVDNSIKNPLDFIETNIVGVGNLLYNFQL